MQNLGGPISGWGMWGLEEGGRRSTEWGALRGRVGGRQRLLAEAVMVGKVKEQKSGTLVPIQWRMLSGCVTLN